MSRTGIPVDLAQNLAENVRYLRQRREMTQARLARAAGIPRPTLALLESGSSNPTLAVLSRLAGALGVSIDELLSPPRSDVQLYKRGALGVEEKGGAEVWRLLPDALPGLTLDRMELRVGGRMTGSPHRPGTREYLACERGKLKLFAAGEEIELHPGDVVAFRGDQPHSYVNVGREPAVGYSVVAIAPPSSVKRGDGS
ncbi:MAG: XRE family transcriptional regulator [Myxococcota bacterium]